jgi:hypothetical protein
MNLFFRKGGLFETHKIFFATRGRSGERWVCFLDFFAKNPKNKPTALQNFNKIYFIQLLSVS